MTGRLSRPRRRMIDGVALGLWLTGLAWLVSHEWWVPAGEFGPVYRRLDAWLLMLHAAFGFAALWVFGLLWGVHIPVGWGQRRRMATGASLCGCVGFLVATAYGLYYCGDETLRSLLATAHWVVGFATVGAFAAHRLAKRRR